MSRKDLVRFHERPELRDPTLILAYAGWNDGGECATTAARYLLDQLAPSALASVDTDEFLDFTVARPHARIRNGSGREIVWPDHEFFAIHQFGEAGDLILGLGIEPHTRWKRYCEVIGDLAKQMGVRRVILLGAFLADVIYSQPIQVRGFSADAEQAERFGFGPSSYEGPTGIVGVLGETLRGLGIPTISLWAALPHYVNVSPNSRGALSLLQSLQEITGLRLELSELESQAAEFDEQVSELIAGDPQLSAYVRELKRRAFTQ